MSDEQMTVDKIEKMIRHYIEMIGTPGNDHAAGNWAEIIAALHQLAGQNKEDSK